MLPAVEPIKLGMPEIETRRCGGCIAVARVGIRACGGRKVNGMRWHRCISSGQLPRTGPLRKRVLVVGPCIRFFVSCRTLRSVHATAMHENARKPLGIRVCALCFALTSKADSASGNASHPQHPTNRAGALHHHMTPLDKVSQWRGQDSNSRVTPRRRVRPPARRPSRLIL